MRFNYIIDSRVSKGMAKKYNCVIFLLNSMRYKNQQPSKLSPYIISKCNNRGMIKPG